MMLIYCILFIFSLKSFNIRVNSLSIDPCKNACGIYIHVPFCRRRCFYCDFPIKVIGEKNSNMIQLQREDTIEKYVKNLQREMRQTTSALDWRSFAPIKVESIYFGGGTPSLLPDHLIGRIISDLYHNPAFDISKVCEVTLEMDPGTFTLSRLQNLHALGINRLSIGVQSFEENVLKACGRAHTAEDVSNAMFILSKSPIINYSIDLISSLPGASVELWKKTLLKAIGFGSKHISVYDLQIETGTAFGRWYSPGVFPLPAEATACELYETTVQTLTRAGYEHYEVSNYALAGFRSNHNQKYWSCSPVWAFGMGAASYIGGKRFTRPNKLLEYEEWTRNISSSSNLIREQVFGSSDSLFIPDLLDFVMLSLRTADGLQRSHIYEMYGASIWTKIRKSLEPFILQDLVNDSVERLSLTDPKGFLISNEIISTVFAALS